MITETKNPLSELNERIGAANVEARAQLAAIRLARAAHDRSPLVIPDGASVVEASRLQAEYYERGASLRRAEVNFTSSQVVTDLLDVEANTPAVKDALRLVQSKFKEYSKRTKPTPIISALRAKFNKPVEDEYKPISIRRYGGAFGSDVPLSMEERVKAVERQVEVFPAASFARITAELSYLNGALS